MNTTVEPEVFLTSHLARRFGVSAHLVRTYADRLGVAERLGRVRLIRAADVDQIRIGLRAAGHLPAHEQRTAADPRPDPEPSTPARTHRAERMTERRGQPGA